MMRIEGLRDGTAVSFREPTLDDVDRSLQFFMALSDEDQRYLRRDVRSRDIVEGRIQQALRGEVFRLLALDDAGNIVGDGALEFSSEGWRRQTAEIRVIVSREFRRKRLGSLMIQELFRAAQQHEVEKVIAKMAGSQAAVRTLFERLGFHVDAVLPGYIKDMQGEVEDMVVMSCTLDELWHAFKDDKESNWFDG